MTVTANIATAKEPVNVKPEALVSVLRSEVANGIDKDRFVAVLKELSQGKEGLSEYDIYVACRYSTPSDKAETICANFIRKVDAEHNKMVAELENQAQQMVDPNNWKTVEVQPGIEKPKERPIPGTVIGSGVVQHDDGSQSSTKTTPAQDAQLKQACEELAEGNIDALRLNDSSWRKRIQPPVSKKLRKSEYDAQHRTCVQVYADASTGYGVIVCAKLDEQTVKQYYQTNSTTALNSVMRGSKAWHLLRQFTDEQSFVNKHGIQDCINK